MLRRFRLGRLTWLWKRRSVDDDLRAEIETHIDLLIERYVCSGMTPEAARATAARQFGNVTLHREQVHLMNGSRWVDGLTQDVRYALRQLRRGPGFSAVVIATLALGIGGTTAVFSAMHAVLLAPLPYEHPGQLVRLYTQDPGNPSGRRALNLSATRFTALRERARSFLGLAGTRSDSTLTGLDLFRDGQSQRLRILHVTSGYFHTLRSHPFLGAGFNPDDESGTRRVVLSDALWRTRFNGDLAVIGATIQLSGEPYEIAGVASPGFSDPIAGDIDVWLPHKLRGERDTALSTVVGRTHAGVSLRQVDAELASLSHSLERSEDDGGATRIVAMSLHDDVVGPSRDFVLLLLLAVALVLLVACVNVANLLLVRATGRVQEFAVRAALGSGRARLARQLMIETLVLASLGGLAGLMLAALGVRVLETLGHDALPRLDSIGFDPVVLLFAMAVTITTALACGVMPALRLARSDPNRTLMQQSRSATGSRGQEILRNGLAAAQLALALALLAGAGVVSVSFYHLMRVELGFRVDRVLTFEVALPDARYGEARRRAHFQEDLARRLAAISGAAAAGGTSRLPATGSFHPWWVAVETGPLAGTRLKGAGQTQNRTVSGEFFKALAIPVLAGRTFDDRDDETAPLRAVVSANLARNAFPGMALESVIGQRIRVLVGGRREIIGVVGDVTLDVYGRPTATVYTAHRQFAGNRNWGLTQVVATDGLSEQILPAVRSAVAAMDPELVVHRVAPMADVVGRGSSRERFALILIGTFAGVSLMLAAIGLYGVLTYAVRQRTAEIGIRMALGASAGQVRGFVFRQAARVLTAGLVAGTAGALMLERWLGSLVFQISPTDVRVLCATALILTVTALFAAWLPARRATAIEPARTLSN